ncbi:MAG: hypothetical protein BGN99_20340 [Alphaproteobacteria bacterium 65-37]|jgi:hypothetical protein|nr:hypothetical protein [Alphaproteobacteria bacterium]OJU41336.1 MAG: hypothetical protein BGN99_20340 [Alphaproteobacteria bacterium 65-37]
MDHVTLSTLERSIRTAQLHLAELLATSVNGRATTPDPRARYLSFQFHLTRDVPTYFMAIAGHRDLAWRRKLRDFLYRFANDEELHHQAVAQDLLALGLTPPPISADVELWHGYFRSVVGERPFVKLGAAAILQTISDGPARRWVRQILQGDSPSESAARPAMLYRSDGPPHGMPILTALRDAALEQRHFHDLVEGAESGTALYLRMVEWALQPDLPSRLRDWTDASPPILMN